MTNDQSPTLRESTVVITGGDGFVGRYVQEELRAKWPETRVVSWDLPEVDITKPETYVEQLVELQPDWIVHLAALASVPLAFRQPEVVRKVNVEGTRRMLEVVAERASQCRVLVVSSAEIYGRAFNDFGESPVPELALEEARPTNPYASSKRDMEEMVRAEFADRCVRARPFPHFGPGQQEGFVTADFAAQVARIEAGGQEAVMKVGNLASWRDFTDVRDVARAYRLLMESGEVGEVYNVASGSTVRIQAILEHLLEQARVNITVEQDPERLRPSDVPVATGDAEKLRAATGWRPEREWRQTLTEVLDWWRGDGGHG